MLALIFLIAMKPGFFHAVYGMFIPLPFAFITSIHVSGCLRKKLFMILCTSFSDILSYVSVEPQHQQKDTQVLDSTM